MHFCWHLINKSANNDFSSYTQQSHFGKVIIFASKPNDLRFVNNVHAWVFNIINSFMS